MTSNRVTCFDDAIRSRIHLALQYDPPDEERRKELWLQNIARLPKDEIDADEAVSAVEKLAAADMNGREISNTVNTARTLALSEGGKLRADHFEAVVAVWENFQSSLKQIQVASADQKE